MTFPQDLRYTFRMLLKSPATTTIAVITLALGIGANTAMFSLMRQLFVSNFQYKDLNTLVIIQAKNQEKGGNPIGLSVPDLLDFREQNTVFEGIARITVLNALTIQCSVEELAGSSFPFLDRRRITWIS